MDRIRHWVSGAPATSVFIIACVVVYLVTATQSGSLTAPAAGSPLAWDLVVTRPSVEAGGWWRLATSALVHLGVTHIVLNMLLIGLVGRDLERSYGSVVVAVGMLLTAVGGSVGSVLMDPYTAMGGASTIGYGMFAMLVARSASRREDLRGPVTLIIVNLVFTLASPGVSLWGHIGGLVVGAVIGAVLYLGRGRLLRTR
ncbi:rhomboid family intramembrane serine protease [Corynebacterium bovis]|uniref:rhomboid family intramembrane serine protease n=1 Tax=Corynebacterium bovis TaxID=36808 RepID=UPI00313892B8